MFNVAIGISINHIRDALSKSNRFKLVQLIQLNHDIEDQFFFVTGILRRLRLGPFVDPTKCVILMQKTDEVVVKCRASPTKMTLDDVTRWTANLNYGRVDGNTKDSIGLMSFDAGTASEATNERVVGSIPASTLLWAKQIIDERKEREKEKSQQEVETKPVETKPVVNEYTNLYWQPEDYSVYENEYEIVEDNSQKLGQAGHTAAGCSSMGSGGILRSMRESLLRELRRDLNKLTNRTNETSAAPDASAASSGGAAAAAGTDPKFVNVRPGLALGLITLQAGHRGPKISLH